MESGPTAVSRSPICWVQSAPLLMRGARSARRSMPCSIYMRGSGPLNWVEKNRTGSSKDCVREGRLCAIGPMRDSFRPISLCANRPIASPAGDARKRSSFIATRWGDRQRGTWEYLGFRLSFAQTREQGSRTYVWRDQVFQRRIEVPQLKGTLTDYHEAMAYMTISLPHLAVEFGKDEARWGPGRQDNLGLSNHAPSFTMLRLKSKLWCLPLGEHRRRAARLSRSS